MKREDWRGIPILMTDDDIAVAWSTALVVTGAVLLALVVICS